MEWLIVYGILAACLIFYGFSFEVFRLFDSWQVRSALYIFVGLLWPLLLLALILAGLWLGVRCVIDVWRLLRAFRSQS